MSEVLLELLSQKVYISFSDSSFHHIILRFSHCVYDVKWGGGGANDEKWRIMAKNGE